LLALTYRAIVTAPVMPLGPNVSSMLVRGPLVSDLLPWWWADL
jgi:hypothetical protein